MIDKKKIKTPNIPKVLDNGEHIIPDKLEDEGIYRGLEITGKKYSKNEAGLIEIKQSLIRKVSFNQGTFESINISDSRLINCDFSNCSLIKAKLVQDEFSDCKILGIDLTNSNIKHVKFTNCILEFAYFRFSYFRNVEFNNCDLKKSNFQGADLSGILFRKCNLKNADFSQTKLKNTDLRNCKIEEIKVGIEELQGAIADSFQALYLSTLLGIKIRDI